MIIEIDRELQEVLPRYLRGRQEDLGHLELALDRKDFDAIKKIGSRVAGNAAGYGLNVLGDISRELETCAADRRFDECKVLVSRIRSFLFDVRPKFV